jgi:hypothetical protein
MLMQSTRGAAGITTPIPGFTNPNKWLKLQRSGSQFTTSYSVDGVSWAPIGSTTVAMTGPVTIGLFATGHHSHQFSTAAFDNVRFTDLGPPPPPPPCPTEWTCSDIGNPSLAGSGTATTGEWTIKGAGNDIHGNADQFQFDYKTPTGTGGITARLLTQANTSSWAKAGLMLRSSTDPSAINYALLVTPGNGIFVQYRSAQGGTTNRIATVSGTVPAYLQVRRSGTTFTAYTSTDGSTWTLLAGSTVTIAISGPMLEGLAVTSHNTTALCTVTMDLVVPS